MLNRDFQSVRNSGVLIMRNFIKTFIADESGASAAEYALILAIVGVGIGAAALLLGTNIQSAIKGASDDVYNCAVSGTATATAGTTLPNC